MQCMGCGKDGHIIKLTPQVEVCLCLDCMEIARRWVPKQVIWMKQVGARVDITA
jgi:6-phosphogluconolactonase/glucosamine-6-phosphate isomerase/deaminase